MTYFWSEGVDEHEDDVIEVIYEVIHRCSGAPVSGSMHSWMLFTTTIRERCYQGVFKEPT
jgi:hypothetical protein